LETLAGRVDELYTVASNTAYEQIYVTYVSFIFIICIFLYFDFLLKVAYQSKIVGVPEVIGVPQFEETWPRLENYVYNLFIW
jgi:hypothetical protein